jgi:ubiquinone/menaquinone biosynthesis C-methylase UbiE
MPSPPLTPLAAAVLHVDRAPERILEIDCGTGEGTLFLAREFPQARVRGVDRSEEMVRAAVAKIGLDPEGRVAFKVGKPGALPYPDDLFDLVAQVDSRPATGEIVRVLQPGGHLVLAVSKLPRGPLQMKQERQTRRLARRGFETVETDQAGDGAFYVGRLGGA